MTGPQALLVVGAILEGVGVVVVVFQIRSAEIVLGAPSWGTEVRRAVGRFWLWLVAWGRRVIDKVRGPQPRTIQLSGAMHSVSTAAADLTLLAPQWRPDAPIADRVQHLEQVTTQLDTEVRALRADLRTTKSEVTAELRQEIAALQRRMDEDAARLREVALGSRVFQILGMLVILAGIGLQLWGALISLPG